MVPTNTIPMRLRGFRKNAMEGGANGKEEFSAQTYIRGLKAEAPTRLPSCAEAKSAMNENGPQKWAVFKNHSSCGGGFTLR